MRSIGYVEFLAAEILDALVQAGFTQEGRPLDISQISTGGMQRSFPPARDIADAMTRRGNDLRRKARLLGGTYNPSMLQGQEGPPGIQGPKGPPGPPGPPPSASPPIDWKGSATGTVSNNINFPDAVALTTVIIEGKTAGSGGNNLGTWIGRWDELTSNAAVPDRIPLSGENYIEFYKTTPTQLKLSNTDASASSRAGVVQANVGPKGDKGDKGDEGDPPTVDNVYPVLKETVKAGAGATVLVDDDRDELIFSVNKQPGRWIFAGSRQWTEANSTTEVVSFDTNIPSTVTDINLNIFKVFYYPKYDNTGLKYPAQDIRFNTMPTSYDLTNGSWVFRGSINSRDLVFWRSTFADGAGNSFYRLNIRKSSEDAFPKVVVFYTYAPLDIALPSGGSQQATGTTYTFEDEGTVVSGTFDKINFKGTTIQASADPDDATTLDVTVSASEGLTFEDEGTAVTGTFTKVNFKGDEISAAADPNDASTLDVTVSATEADITDAEFSGQLGLFYGTPWNINLVSGLDGSSSPGDAVLSTDNTPMFGSDTFLGYLTLSNATATILADNLLPGDGVWVQVKKANTAFVDYGDFPGMRPRANRIGFTNEYFTNESRADRPWLRAEPTYVRIYYDTLTLANNSAFMNLAIGSKVRVTALSTSDGGTDSRIGKSSVFTVSSTPRSSTATIGGTWSYSYVTVGGTWSSYNSLNSGEYDGGNGISTGPFTGAKWITYKATNDEEPYLDENAGEIMSTVAGIRIPSGASKTLEIWLGKETWTTGLDKWGELPNGAGTVRFYRDPVRRIAAELPGVPAQLVGFDKYGKLGHIPTDDLAAHVVGPEGKFFTLMGTWGLTTGGALPSTARKISISGSGNTRIVNVTGTGTASDRVNQHLQAFFSDGQNVTIRVSTAQTGGWRFKITGTVNVNTLANGGWGFTATTISGTPPTNTVSTYSITVDGDIVRWTELFSEGIKPAIKAGTNMTVVANDTDGTLTLNSTASGGGSYTLPTANTTTKGGLETATQAEADALTALDKILTPNVLKEAVYECLKSILAAGTNITITNSDTGHTSTLASSGGSNVTLGPLGGAVTAAIPSLTNETITLTTTYQDITGFVSTGSGYTDRSMDWFYCILAAQYNDGTLHVERTIVLCPARWAVGNFLQKKLGGNAQGIELQFVFGTGDNSAKIKIQAKRNNLTNAWVYMPTIF